MRIRHNSVMFYASNPGINILFNVGWSGVMQKDQPFLGWGHVKL